MQIQVAKPEDSENILRLYLQFNEDRVKSGVGDAHYKTLEGELPWKKTLSDGDCLTLIAKEKGLVLGFITLRMPQFNPFNRVGKLSEVDLIVVEQRLRRRHIGSVLYEAAVSRLKEIGVTHVLLNVKIGNVPAMVFWTRMGFKKVSSTDYKRSDGVEEETMYMLKKI
jgi:ribosomal protein S18 acetylase RimI-like enzyme